MKTIRVNGTDFHMSDRSYDLTIEGAQMQWDSERRDSPYSTVADPSDDSYCEACDQTVDYSDDSKHGK